MASVKNGLLRFGKEQGIKIGIALVEDVAKKGGLQQTLDVGKNILKHTMILHLFWDNRYGVLNNRYGVLMFR
jgi:hypothetical protein